MSPALALPFARLRHWRASFAATAPAQLRLGRGVLSVSFDDVPASACREGAAVLADFGARATYFVCGAHAGRAFGGVDQFTRNDLARLAVAGHEIGCHTFEHESALAVDPAAWEASLDANAAFLADVLGQDEAGRTSFAYPYGLLSRPAKAIAAARFPVARSVAPGLNAGLVDRARLKAVGLERRKQRAVNWPGLIQAAARRRAWLIVYTHDVSVDPTPHGCRPQDLAGLLASAVEADLEIAPIGDVAARALA